MLRVYVDGACKIVNGRQKGGVGVYFGPKDKRNYSGPLEGQLQTNNRAEIMACIVALERVKKIDKNLKVEILSDSQYVVRSMNQWIKKWEVNGWRSASKKPVLNKDLLVRLKTLEREIVDDGKNIKWTWVKGHSGIIGNEEADKLASNGVFLSYKNGINPTIDSKFSIYQKKFEYNQISDFTKSKKRKKMQIMDDLPIKKYFKSKK